MKKIQLAFILFLWFSLPAFSQVIETSDLSVFENEHNAWRIAAHIGPGFRIGDTGAGDYSTQKYISALKNGTSYGVEATYYLFEVFGFGVKMLNYNTSNSAMVTASLSSGERWTGKMSDKINITYMGPVASYRLFSANRKHALLMNAGLGYLYYKDKAFLAEEYILSNGTLGLHFDVGYEYALNKSLSIGIEASYIAGTLGSVNVKTNGQSFNYSLGNNNRESLSTLSIMAGLRLNL